MAFVDLAGVAGIAGNASNAGSVSTVDFVVAHTADIGGSSVDGTRSMARVSPAPRRRQIVCRLLSPIFFSFCVLR